MRVIWHSPDPLARMHTMTARKGKTGTIDVKALLAGDEEFLRALVRTALQEVLEVEMTQALGAEKSERTTDRLGYRSGYYGRTLVTRIGKLELRVPQDRGGRFSTELFERYQRSERSLVAALAGDVSRSASAPPDFPAVRAARRVIKATGAHRRIKTVPRMTKPGPGPQWSAMAPTARGIAIAASRFMVWRSPTTEP